jgi:hypothetical protein
MLPPSPTGPVGVDSQVSLVQIHLHRVVDLRYRRDAGEGGVPAGLGVEGRDPNQAVHALLGVEIPVGVLSRDTDGGAPDSSFLPLLKVQDLGLQPAALGPAQVHAQQHLRPVTGIGAAGPRVDREDRVRGVVLPPQQLSQLGLLELRRGAPQLLGGLGERLGVVGLGGQLEQDLSVVEGGGEPVQEGELPVHPHLLAEELLGRLAIIPEVGTRRLGLQPIAACLECVQVKDAPGTRRSGRAGGAAEQRARWNREPGWLALRS